jgi:hypothetical protein
VHKQPYNYVHWKGERERERERECVLESVCLQKMTHLILLLIGQSTFLKVPKYIKLKDHSVITDYNM